MKKKQMNSIDRLLTTLFENNTKKLLDNLSNESSTNSSGFHSKSTTTIYNNEYSPSARDSTGINFSGRQTRSTRTIDILTNSH